MDDPRSRPERFIGLSLMALVVAQALLPVLRAQPGVAVPLLVQTPSSHATPNDEPGALRNAFESASGNPQLLIQNLGAFLARFPESPRRAQVLRTILQQGLQNNNPEKAMDAAEMLLELEPSDPRLLSTFAELIDRPTDSSSRQQALHIATRLVEHAERSRQQAKVSHEQQSLLRASSYLIRGKVHEKSGEDEKALADYVKSYAAYPSAMVAERLGDLEAKRGDVGRALDNYASAFAFPESEFSPEHRAELRRKLGKVYVAKFHSEKGLGDLILARSDELTHALEPRLRAQSPSNTRALDPFEYTLSRMDGSEIRLKDVLGKVVVMDFWATWCAPCRVEGKLLERVRQALPPERRVVFLAVDTDEDRSGVPAFVKEQQWTLPVVYAGGIDRLLGVRALPTLLIFDPKGRVIFRAEGLDPSTFEQTVERKLREALAAR